MIAYQLPNGKTIYLTVDQLLRLDDNDIQYMIEMNMGTTSNPFKTMDPSLCDHDVEIPEEINDLLDMLNDGDDDPYLDIDINNIPDNN